MRWFIFGLDMMRKKYGCACILQDDGLRTIKVLQEKVFALTGSQQYRQEWIPHITIGVGNILDDKEVAVIIKQLELVAHTQTGFFVNLEGITFTENPQLTKIRSSYTPYVVRIGVTVCPALQALVHSIDPILRPYDMFYEIMPYAPHMGIAGRDLTREGWLLLQKEFATEVFSARVFLHHFSLFLPPLPENGISRMQEVGRFAMGKVQ